MESFDDVSQKDEFRKWMRDHPRGYYLNRRGRPSMMLHRAGCGHLGNGEPHEVPEGLLGRYGRTRSVGEATGEVRRALQHLRSLRNDEVSECDSKPMWCDAVHDEGDESVS